VLEVGGVVDAGRQHDHARVGHALGRGGAQRVQQLGRVVVDRADPGIDEERRQGLAHHAAVLDDVADPARDAQVVLQHPELPVLVPDEVDAGDVHAHAVGRVDAVCLAVEVGARGDQPARYHPVGEDLTPAVHVGEETLEGGDPLAHGAGDEVPLGGVDDPGDQVERERPLLPAVGESDATVGEHPRQLVGAEPQVGAGQRLQGREQGLVRRPGHARALEHLVPRGGHLVRVEDVRHERTLLRPRYRRINRS
jgi:hypothetical protein